MYGKGLEGAREIVLIVNYKRIKTFLGGEGGGNDEGLVK